MLATIVNGKEFMIVNKMPGYECRRMIEIAKQLLQNVEKNLDDGFLGAGASGIDKYMKLCFMALMLKELGDYPRIQDLKTLLRNASRLTLSSHEQKASSVLIDIVVIPSSNY